MIKPLHKFLLFFCGLLLSFYAFHTVYGTIPQQHPQGQTPGNKNKRGAGTSKKKIKKQVTAVKARTAAVKRTENSTRKIDAVTDAGGDTVITYNSPLAFCQNESVNLTAKYAVNTDKITWFKDGDTIANAIRTIYTARIAGSYYVLVNDIRYAAVTVVVNPLPVAGFTFTGDRQCASVPVRFTGTSTGNNLKYEWNFGDPNSGNNNTSTLKDPVHKFVGSPGNGNQQFDVRLKVTTNAGCTNEKVITVTTQQPTDTQLGGPSPVVYNGERYFRGCSNAAAIMTFTNQSGTTAINESYTIKWGDGSADYTDPTFAGVVRHTYQIGTYRLTYIIKNKSGCIDTANYRVFVGGNPAVGFGNPGNTAICTGSALTFPVTGTANNPPGTTYTVSFSDGSAPKIYTTAPDTVVHYFTRSSCGTTTDAYDNAFSATIVASNPCSSSQAVVSPIYVSQKPVAGFSASTDAVCVGGQITFENTSLVNNVSADGCVEGNFVWKISPNTDIVVNNNDLGKDFGESDPTIWQSGAKNLRIRFTKAGTYTLTLKTGSPTCGLDSITKTICVNPPPTASFTTNISDGCAPLAVKTTNTSPAANCGTNTYQWSVSPNRDFSYTNGTNAGSANPQFQFTGSGQYTISLVTISPGGYCRSDAFTKTISVNAKPVINLDPVGAICQGNSIQPRAAVTPASGVTYLWTFPGGTPATSALLNPATITYTTAGNFTATLVATSACGVTTATVPVIVNSTPVVTQPNDQHYCEGEITPVTTLSSNVPGTTFRWTNSNTSIGLSASGSGNIPVFAARNTGNLPLTATITVTPRTNDCPGLPVTFTITVNPRADAPVVSPLINYCKNETVAPLSATASTGNTLNWYSNAALTNKLNAAPVPSTATEGRTTYYVTQSNSYNCEGPAAAITVVVSPGISNNVIGRTQTICYNTSPGVLEPTAVLSGGTGVYGYQWQSSADGSNWTDIPNARGSSYAPGNLTASVQFRRIVSSGGCANTSNAVVVTVQGSLTHYDISGTQSICTGTAPTVLNGDIPTGGNGVFTYQWQVSANNAVWTDINGAIDLNYQPANLTATSYYRRLTKSGDCSGYSNVVTITVNPLPVVNPVNSPVYCSNSSTNQIAFSSSAAGNISYTWTNDNPAVGLAAGGQGNIPVFTTANNTHVPVTGHISVKATLDAGASCEGPPANFSITVLPLIKLQAIADQGTCSGLLVSAVTPVNDAAAFAGSKVTYTWTIAGPDIGLRSGSGNQIPAFTAVNNGLTDLAATVTVTPVYTYLGKSCEGVPANYKITVRSQPVASAGDDIKVCIVSSIVLNGNKPDAGLTGTWAVVSGPGTPVFSPDANTYNATVSGLQPGTYDLKWTVNNNACGESSDHMQVINLPPLTNTITAPVNEVCLGIPVNISGTPPTGGDGRYNYSWQSSTDNQTWTKINGEYGAGLTITLAQNMYIRRVVNSAPCELPSNSVYIIVKPAITGNLISGSAEICTGRSAGVLSGNTVTGGDGNFSYIWQSSADGSNWTDIPQAAQQAYLTPVLTATTFYRRLVSSALCQGAQSSISNVLRVVVNPDAQADFTASATSGCAPFDLAQVITPVPHPDRNGTYTWLANGVTIGAGPTFPAYVIGQDGESVLVKLVVTSKFGCDTSSREMRFTTVKSVVAAFTKDQVKACGPITVNFTNTSVPLNGATYSWDFGNGQTSASAQPGAITFQPDLQGRDTTYIITLSAVTSCGITRYRDSVTVRPLPKAIMTPDKTIGCSPFEIHITNQSRGIPNTYTFDFGNGDKLVKSDNSAVIYTYVTTRTDTVTLRMIAENECGRDTTAYRVVIYPNNVTANLVVNGDNKFGCAPMTVQFDNNTTGANNFQYDFGDGNIATTSSAPETVLHTFTQPGVYTVKLTASNGCSTSSTTQIITVYPQPVAAFTISQSQYCVKDAVVFTNQSALEGYSYLWDFKDGTTSNATNPVHRFAQPGIYNVTLTLTHSYPNGSVCSSSISHPVEVITAPVAAFTSNATTLNCAPFTLITNTTPANASSVEWDFGDPGSDDNTGIGYSLSHTYTKPGVYRVRLVAYNQNSCADTIYQNVRVTERPLASFTPVDSVLCGASATIAFKNTSTYSGTDLVTYRWLVNNILVSAQKNLNTTLTPPANAVFPYTFTITLEVNSTRGCSDRVSHTVIFHALPKADFTVQNTTGCAPFLVKISNTSTHADQYAWYLDGTLISSDQIPARLVLENASRNYRLKLVVSNQFGCITSAIEKTLNTYPSPVAAFDLRDSISCSGVLDVKITNRSTGASSYAWDFGDGSQQSTAVTPTHIYGGPGIFSLRLIVSNGTCLDTVSHIVRIAATPKAAFTAGNLKGCSQLTTTFQNASANASSYLWDFGDGTFSTSKNPTHTYTYINSPFTVKLIAYGEQGCADTTLITKYISVTAPPVADFKVLPDTVVRIPDYTFQFSNKSAGETVKIKWNFGDGKISETENPTHTYTDTGTYKVTLLVTNVEGCADTLVKRVHVQGVPGYLYVPNAFEPGSGKTELKTFNVRASGLSAYSLRIFNKFGQLIFQTSKLLDDAPAEGWDGMMFGKPAPQGVYVWLISANFINGTEWKGMKYKTGAPTKTGPIHLIR